MHTQEGGADWDSICGLWRADDPQLCQSYRVSHAATTGRSRGCVCVPVAEGLCVFVLIIKFLWRLKSFVCLEGVCVVDVCVCVWEVSDNVTMWAEKQSTMKNLFRLCAGVCANDTYQPASRIQVSPSLSFYFESQPEFLCTNNSELLFPFYVVEVEANFCIWSKCKCMHICTFWLCTNRLNGNLVYKAKEQQGVNSVWLTQCDWIRWLHVCRITASLMVFCVKVFR